MNNYNSNNKYDIFTSGRMKRIKIAIIILIVDIVAAVIYVKFIKN